MSEHRGARSGGVGHRLVVTAVGGCAVTLACWVWLMVVVPHQAVGVLPTVELARGVVR